MTVQSQIDQLIAHRASEWVEILRTGGPEEQAAFTDWLRESRKHVAEFLAMAVLDEELNAPMFKDLVDREALLKRLSPRVAGLESTPGKTQQPVPHRGTVRRTRRSRYFMAWGAAAGIAAIAVSFVILRGVPSSQDLATQSGEQRAIELADGSVVLMNANSHVHVSFSRSSRDLKLMSGEALFKVARDPHRPFLVRTRDMVIRALGTQFNVNARKAETVVSVLEGRILLSPQETGRSSPPSYQDTKTLGAGEEVQVTNGKINRHARIASGNAADWRQRRLVFQQAEIGKIVHEFNRHNTVPKLRLDGIEPTSRHYSAIFDAEDPSSFADFLNREPNVTVERQGNEIVIRGR